MTQTTTTQASTKPAAAKVLREYGPFPGVDQVGGVTFDGHSVWMAVGDRIAAFDPDSGAAGRSLARCCRCRNPHGSLPSRTRRAA